MKKQLLILFIMVVFKTGNSQNIVNTQWLGTNAPSPNLWFLFGTDTLYYSLTPSGFTPLSLYTASNGQFNIFDLPGASFCTDTGHYNYSIVNPNLLFSLINDVCASRRNTLLNYNWIQIPTGTDELPLPSDIVIYQNPGEGFFSLTTSVKMTGNKEITLFDVNGKKVYKENFVENKIKVNINFLPMGVYVGRLINGSKNKSFVVIR